MTKQIVRALVVVMITTASNTFAQELKYDDFATMKKQTMGGPYTSYRLKNGTVLSVGDKLVVKTATADDHYYAVVKGQNSFSIVKDDLKGTVLTISRIYPFKDNANGGKFIPLLTTTNEQNSFYTVSAEFAFERGEVELIEGGAAAASTTAPATASTGGQVSSNVKSIDCSEIYPFMDGLAIVTKGTAEGVINSKGEFVVPFNKWKFRGHTNVFGQVAEGFVNGSCVVQGLNNEGYGVIDKQGNLIIPTDNLIAFPFDDSGLSLILNNGKYYFVDRNKKRTEVAAPFLRKQHDLNMESMFMDNAVRKVLMTTGAVDAVFTSKGVSMGKSDKGYTVFDINGVPKSQNYFIDARHFSNGLAAVSRTNEFGELKWGFIDERGEIVIPMQYSNEPGDFNEDLALVIPMDQNDFHYAYIDKSGNVAFTVKEDFRGYAIGSAKMSLSTNPNKKSGFATMGRFQDDYAFLPYDYGVGMPGVLIDRKGKSHMTNISAKLGKSSIKLPKVGASYTDLGLTDGQILLNDGGLLDLKRNVVIPGGTYDELSVFDPVSSLARARKGEVTGYINRDGQFVIVVGKPSKW